jgi:nickel transport protein
MADKRAKAISPTRRRNPRRRSLLIPLSIIGLLLCTPLQAHRLKVFATAEGARIDGTAYFVGGAKASGATIEVLDPQGRELARVTPDEDGAFSYIATQRMDHEFVADSRDGHRASWTVRADELPADLPPPDDTGSLPEQPAADGQVPVSAPAAAVDDGKLVSLVERAVARQVRPLREELDAYGDRVRLHDILGGLGYIAGIAGLGLWWRNRRRKDGR